MNRKDTLDAAAACVLTDRQRTHGPIENSFGLIASLWSVYLSVTVTPFDVAEMMTLLKIARGKGNPLNPDNQVDGAGYQACAAELAESMADVKRSDDLYKQIHINRKTPNAVPDAPQTHPEGDHSQTDAGAQGDAIPDDCDDMWHNPENYPLTPEEMAEGWRFLTKDETTLPDDAKFKYTPDGAMHRGYAEDRDRQNSITYFTRAPLPHYAFNALADAVDVIQVSRATAPEPQWHNPEMIDPSHLTEGRRFLLKDETELPGDVEAFGHVDKEWRPMPGSTVRFAGWTYATRTPLPGAPTPEAPVDHNLHQTAP